MAKNPKADWRLIVQRDIKARDWTCLHSDPVTGTKCTHRTKLKINIKVHAMQHLLIKPYRCEICSRSFTTKQNQKDHQSRHEKLRRFTCPMAVCNKAFYRKCELKSHVVSCHREEDYLLKSVNQCYPDERKIKRDILPRQ